jgi:hypothetical protein
MKRSSKPLPKDPNQLAYKIVQMSTEETKRSVISEYLASIGKKGGLKGGRARADSLTPERRKEIAQKAAKTRWGKQ